MILTRIALENFRAFERAEFDLVDGKQVPLRVALLVGPNGAGKSSVLHAVAGTCTALQSRYGADPLRFHDVTQGKESGEVTLTVHDLCAIPTPPQDLVFSLVLSQKRASRLGGLSAGAASYHQLLNAREPTGGAIVRFDAHRLLPVTKVAGPNTELVPRNHLHEALRPTVAADGTIVPRFGRLHQWIVNLDFRRAKAKADRDEGFAAWEILKAGLDTLLRPYRFLGVNDDNEVLFETPSGKVPLEALSDGFRSLFVVVAELMMRLSLAYGRSETFLAGEACCLIDEIDAHLHPRWQESVIPGLRALFPNVQFIATTHSPIVVSSVRAAEVFHVGPAEDL